MYYPDEVVEQVIASNDIVDVIGQYVHLKRSGANYFGLCPFHNEKTPSFSVSPGKQMFYCFGCGEGGNVISFLMKHENYSFQEALKVLADRAGIKLPEPNYSEEAKKAREQRERLMAINKEAATYYFRLLRSPAGRRGLQYFTERKLSPQTMNSFGLGFADGANSDLVAHLRKMGFQDEEILTSGVAAYDEKRGLHDKFWNRVMFPIMDVTNRVIGFGGRVMGDGKPKYLNSPETPVFDKSRNLYGLNVAKKTKCGYFILCEGYMDVIAMHQAGFTQAVASLGTSFTEGQAAVIKRYVKLVLLSYDSDGAGVRAAMRNIGVLHNAGVRGKVVNLEPYKDPDEFMKNLGAEEFQKRLDNAEDSFSYQIRQIEKNYRMDDPSSRSDFMHEIAKRLCAFDDEIERDAYIKAMASQYSIGEDVLRREVAAYGTIYDARALAEQIQGEDHRAANGRAYQDAASERDRSGAQNTGRFPSGSSVGGGFPQDGEYGSAGPGAASVPMRPRDGTAAKRESKMERAVRRNEGLLLTWLSDDPDLYPQLRDYISAEDFSEGISRQAAEKYFSLLEKEIGDRLAVVSGNAGKAHANPGTVIAAFENENDQTAAAGLFETRIPGVTENELEKALRDVCCQLKRETIRRITEGMSNGTVPDAVARLMKAKKDLAALRTIPLRIRINTDESE